MTKAIIFHCPSISSLHFSSCPNQIPGLTVLFISFKYPYVLDLSFLVFVAVNIQTWNEPYLLPHSNVIRVCARAGLEHTGPPLSCRLAGTWQDLPSVPAYSVDSCAAGVLSEALGVNSPVQGEWESGPSELTHRALGRLLGNLHLASLRALPLLCRPPAPHPPPPLSAVAL